MNISELIQGEKIDEELGNILSEIHSNGPINPEVFERLSYYKRFHREIFSKYESRLISLMGLFYKKEGSHSLLEEVYAIFSNSIGRSFGRSFTPVQADAFSFIKEFTYFSFSAPTSAGKSFLFRVC